MDGRGGCCIARYGGYGGRYGLSKADRIMLRFRPIAPKPSSDGGGGSPAARKYGSTTTSGGSSDFSRKSGRGKRKYQKGRSGGNSRRCNRKKRSATSDGGDASTATAVTLSLLQQTPEKRVFPELNVSPVVVSSCVTVERVTEAWIDGYGLGKTDDEWKMNLVRDTCPGFISDGVGIVTWTNDAYRKMAKEDINIPMEEGAPADISYDNFHVIVRLVMKDRPMLTYPAFTCRVRLQYTCQDRERGSVTVPCDVWRMDGGGYAWRLDVKAALCL